MWQTTDYVKLRQVLSEVLILDINGKTSHSQVGQGVTYILGRGSGKSTAWTLRIFLLFYVNHLPKDVPESIWTVKKVPSP